MRALLLPLVLSLASPTVVFAATSSHQVAYRVQHASAPHEGVVLYPDGSYRYPFGETIPTVRVGVGDECDIQLQPGEKINQAIISDSLRWKATDGVSGSDTPHMFVKPTQSGIWATLTITTTRRVYHVRLESADGRQNEYVGFYYPTDMTAIANAERRRAARREHEANLAAATERAQAAISATYGCTNLDSKYKVGGANEFRPTSVCNDGAHTYINVSEIPGDLPQPYTLDNRTDEIANYSYDHVHHQFVLDGVPTRLALIRGTGHDQLRTTFERVR